MSNTPSEIAALYPQLGAQKAKTQCLALFFRAVMAGMYIAMATMGALSVNCLIEDARIASLISALLFPAGLSMVLLTGSELFTGNHLMTLSLLKRQVSLPAMLRAWGIVFVGNLVGAISIAWLSVTARGTDATFLAACERALEIKASLPMGQAFWSGVLCNLFVCTAVWMSYGAKSAAGKIVAVYFPVMLFVLCRTEHCVANMYYQFAGLFAASAPVSAFAVRNLIPVTMGNIVGGAILLSGLLFFAHVRGVNVQTADKP